MKQLMLSATAGGESLKMTSREIAELTGKQHAHVMRDIRAMMEALSKNPELDSCAKSTTYTGKDGRAYEQYELNKDTCLTLLLGYDAVARMRVVKRWQELEAAVTAPIAVEDYAVTRLVALRAAGLLSSVGAEVASFRLLGLRPPPSLVRAMEPTAISRPPVAVQLELAPQRQRQLRRVNLAT
jgi:hypothetical protein